MNGRGLSSRIQDLFHFRNQLFFNFDDGLHGTEPWHLTAPVGDTNFDGLVDLTDLNNVRNHFGQTGNVLGDADGNGTVDLSDLNAVRNHFGGVAAAVAVDPQWNGQKTMSGEFEDVVAERKMDQTNRDNVARLLTAIDLLFTNATATITSRDRQRTSRGFGPSSV